MTTCLFCNIVARAIPAQVVLENEHVLAFRDIRPVAPVHALVIPKRHITGVHDVTADDVNSWGNCRWLPATPRSSSVSAMAAIAW